MQKGDLSSATNLLTVWVATTHQMIRQRTVSLIDEANHEMSEANHEM